MKSMNFLFDFLIGKPPYVQFLLRSGYSWHYKQYAPSGQDLKQAEAENSKIGSVNQKRGAKLPLSIIYNLILALILSNLTCL